MVRGSLFAGGALGLTVVALPLGLVLGAGYCGVRLRRALQRRRQWIKEEAIRHQLMREYAAASRADNFVPTTESADQNQAEDVELSPYSESKIDRISVNDLGIERLYEWRFHTIVYLKCFFDLCNGRSFGIFKKNTTLNLFESEFLSFLVCTFLNVTEWRSSAAE